MKKLDFDIIERLKKAEENLYCLNGLIEDRLSYICDFIIDASSSEKGEFGTVSCGLYDDGSGSAPTIYGENISFNLYNFDYIVDSYAIINWKEYLLIDCKNKRIGFPTEFIYQDFEEKITTGMKEWQELYPNKKLKIYGTPSIKLKEKRLKETKQTIGYLKSKIESAENLLKKLENEVNG